MTWSPVCTIWAWKSAQHAVGLPAAAGQWIITAYTLAFAGLLLVGGRLADRLGARRTLLATAIEEGRDLSSMSGILAGTACRLLLA